MLNNKTLKSTAKKTKNLKHLAYKNTLTYAEYMQLVCSDTWQKHINKTLNTLKNISPEWY